MFDAWQLAMIDEAGYNGINDEHISRLVQSLESTGQTYINSDTFERHCYKCGIDPDNFSQEDLAKLEQRLNKWN